MRSDRPLRIFLAGLVFATSLLIVHDTLANRDREITTRAAVSTIEMYRRYISPRLVGRVQCRFKPTCSAYGLASVKKHGAVVGGFKAVGRIARCNPWTPMGTSDPP
ncbi:MAG TPA: membrane protein insertion efficiency factor YidD [Thermoanaerobaculia bacterium]|nr:membrane protein insertion efficiency factor YidD [Thermoanaerobaculia bacterium]